MAQSAWWQHYTPNAVSARSAGEAGGFGMQAAFDMHRGLTQMAYDSLCSCLPVLQAMAPFPHKAACILVSRPVPHLHSDTTVSSNFDSKLPVVL